MWRRSSPPRPALEGAEIFPDPYDKHLPKLGQPCAKGVQAARAVLINDKGERFMTKYAAHVKDLASRDVVSRAIYTEIREGRGISGQPSILDIQPEAVVRTLHPRPVAQNADGSAYIVTGEDALKKLPDIIDFCRVYLGVDPITQMMPIQPTAHYTMGGIPTNKYGEVVLDDKATIVPGLYAAGECACVSVHGANRLGTNSLLDLVVFGKHAGTQGSGVCQTSPVGEGAPGPGSRSEIAVKDDRHASGKQNAFDIANEMKKVMFDLVGVYRNEKDMQSALEKIRELQERNRHVSMADTGKISNTELLNAWELGNLLDVAEVVTVSALNQRNRRGQHGRKTFPGGRCKLAQAYPDPAKERQAGDRLQTGDDH